MPERAFRGGINMIIWYKTKDGMVRMKKNDYGMMIKEQEEKKLKKVKKEVIKK